MSNDDPRPERWPGDELMENDEALWHGILHGGKDPELTARLMADTERDELLEKPCPPWKM